MKRPSASGDIAPSDDADAASSVVSFQARAQALNERTASLSSQHVALPGELDALARAYANAADEARRLAGQIHANSPAPITVLPPPLLSAKELSERWKIDKSGVHRLARAGAFPHIKVGKSVRFAPADILAYEAANKCGG